MYLFLKIAVVKALPSPLGQYHQLLPFAPQVIFWVWGPPTKSWRAHKPRCFSDQEGDNETSSNLERRNFSFAGYQALPADQQFSFEDVICKNQMIGGCTGLAHRSLNSRICGIY
jgi:hypothetical protein